MVSAGIGEASSILVPAQTCVDAEALASQYGGCTTGSTCLCFTRLARVLTSARRVLSPEQPRQVIGPKNTSTGDGPVRQAGRPRSGATHRGWLRPSTQVPAGMNTEPIARCSWVGVL
jgi:hypothetical protein